MGKSKNEYEYYLRNWMVVLLLVLYSFYIISGISIVIYVLCIYDFESEIMMHTLMASFATCLMTCSMQYIKRLYKAGIYNRIIRSDEKNSGRVIGTFSYFLLRPLFACVFVIIAIVALKGGIIVVLTTDKFMENERFFYVSVVMSACIGFSVGKVIDAFENFAERNVSRCMEGGNGTRTTGNN
ncbi:MAG: hypothetical protein SOX33_07865 [Agathobacter sp.]|nr:hypothetical protein [Agathobacter sp.]